MASTRGRAWDSGALLAKQVASLVGVDSRTVSRWAVKGCPRNPDKTYSLAAVCGWIREGSLDLAHVPQTSALAVLGVTKPTLADMHKRGLPRNRDKSYDVVQCVRWRIGELEERIRLARQSSVLESVRIRKMTLEAQRAEMDLAERRGELLPRQAVLAGWVARYQTLKASLLGMLGRLGQHGLEPDHIAAVRTEIQESLRRLGGNQVALQLTDHQARILAALVDTPAIAGKESPS